MVVDKKNDDGGFFGYIGKGGVAGRNSTNSVIENCYNRAYVTTEDGFIHNIGGITGKNEGGSTVDNCYNNGYVEGAGEVTNNVGAIVGQNSENSTVTHCYYEEDSVYRGDMSNGDGKDGVGTNAATGTVEKVEERTAEDFASGEVAWELSQSTSTDGSGWGQNLDDTLDGVNSVDGHPHFTDMLDKDAETTAVYRVTFTSAYLPCDKKYYVDPGATMDIEKLTEDGELPSLSEPLPDGTILV